MAPREERSGVGWRALVHMHRGILLLLLVALFPLFGNLGAGTLWADEGDTAVFARSILATGLPRAWDGTTFTESDRGRRLTDDLLLVGTPWVPFYLTAGSLALFGETTFAARLPFALAGLMTLALLYELVLRTTRDRLAALLASGLLLTSVPFLIYARQCRHYALNMLLSVALLLAFPRLERRRVDWWFVAIAVLLYHCHPLPAGVTLAALGFLSLMHPAFRAARRGFCLSLPVILALTAPWALVAFGGWDENSRRVGEAFDLWPRVQQFAYEASLALPILGWLVLARFAARRLGARDRAFLTLTLTPLALYALLTPLVQSTLQLWEYGLRYLTALLPLGAAVTGLLIARAVADRSLLAVALAALFALTHLPGSLALWMLVRPTPPPEERPAEPRASLHRPAGKLDEIFRTELAAYARELVEWVPGTDARIIAFLQANARPGELLLTNYAWEPLYFHTRLPQAYKVLEGYPIREAAQARGLPRYVFEPEGARWLVWRVPWEDYQGYRWADVSARLEATGATLRQVASFPETTWENRENLHFRRFPGVGYLYPDGTAPSAPARIYRVDPPAVGESGTAPGNRPAT